MPTTAIMPAVAIKPIFALVVLNILRKAGFSISTPSNALGSKAKRVQGTTRMDLTDDARAASNLVHWRSPLKNFTHRNPALRTH